MIINRKEIIDNESENNKLAHFINQSINNSDISIATGYFNLSGYNLIKDKLWNIVNNGKQLRMIVGKEIIDKVSDDRIRLDDLALLDEIAREFIIRHINAPIDKSRGKGIGSNVQYEIKNHIVNAFNNGLLGEEVADIFAILSNANLGPWDDELSDILKDYKRNDDINSLITALEKLFKRYDIKISKRKPKELKINDLQLVGCMFITNTSKL